MSHSKKLQNFGRNREWNPAAYYEPRDQREVLEILDRHRGESFRAIGSLHSWSDAAVSQGVVLSFKNFQQVELQNDPASLSVVVGAGCQIRTLLRRLKESGHTLPSVGLITDQTIAGAISTGTHGSGRHSLSHYVEAVRVARYDLVTCKAIIEEIDSGEALQAARCSLGCLGLILTLRIRCRAVYNVEEHMQPYPTLEPILAAEQDYPQQQFFFVPWQWKFLAQHRREVSSPRSRLASLYRLHWLMSIDIGLHLLILFAARVVGKPRFIRFLYRHIIPRTVIHNWNVTDDSSAMLVMDHSLFRHIEIELFVPSQHLPNALEHLRHVLVAAGDLSQPNAAEKYANEKRDPSHRGDLNTELESLRGTYCHHYPICIRRVLPDDTLISMASGEEQVWYAISLISYVHPAHRDSFLKIADFLARTMAEKFGARPHWGKVCPLPAHSLVALYPQFDRFRTVCESADPKGVFRNQWMNNLFQDEALA